MEDGKGRTQDEQIIDLGINRKEELNESFLRMFGGAVKSLLKRMFGKKVDIPYTFKGSKSEISSFVNTLKNEKSYMDKYFKYGLDDPKTLKQKGELKKSVKKFERKTGLDWPFEF